MANQAPKKVERKYVAAGSGKTTTKGPRTRATGLRITAAVLWFFAIACEVLCILYLNGFFYLPPETIQPMTLLGIGIGVDLILVVIGSQLWKRANHIDPISKKNKIKFFLWNQMGLIVAVVAFMPLVIFLLKDKDLDPKTRKIVSVVAAIALVLAALFSIDWSPVSAEELQHAQDIHGEQTVYWTVFGKSYHLDPDCFTLNRSKVVYHGTIEEAFEANRHDPCDFCVPQEGE